MARATHKNRAHSTRSGLFVTDLDGTLLGPDNKIGASDRAAFEVARDANVEMVIVTGRRRSGFRLVEDALAGLSFRLATSGGSVLLAPDNETPSQIASVGWSLLDSLNASGDIDPLSTYAITAPTGSEDELPDCMVLSRGNTRWTASNSPYVTETLRPVDVEAMRSRSLVHVALHFATREEANQKAGSLRDWLPDHTSSHVVRMPAGPGALLEVVPKGGKALAVAHLCEEFGLSRAATAAIGDELNDVDLLDAADHRYVIGGSVLASQRSDAREVSPAGEGAIAEALEHFLSERSRARD